MKDFTKNQCKPSNSRLETCSEIKDSVKEMSMRVSAIEDTINTIKNHWWKIVSLVIAGILGVDMGSDMMN